MISRPRIVHHPLCDTCGKSNCRQCQILDVIRCKNCIKDCKAAYDVKGGREEIDDCFVAKPITSTKFRRKFKS